MVVALVKVVDASAIYHVLLQTSRAPAVEAHLRDDLFAPDLIVTELLHRLRRLVLGNVITAARAQEAVDVLVASDIEYLHVWPYTERCWDLRHNVTAADAAYAALAEDLRCPLLTTDARLGRAPGLRVPVIVA